MPQILNLARKWSWLALGLGGILLAIVSVRVMNRPATIPVEKATTETVDADSESPSGLLTPEDLKFSENSMETKPPSARMPPIEIRRDYEESDSGRRRFKVESKADGIPAIKDIPPLQMEEPRGIDPAKGQKQAFNEYDTGTDGGAGSDSNAWQPPPEPSEPSEPAMPADDFGGGGEPSPPADMEGDIAPEPRDDFDFGGGGSGD